LLRKGGDERSVGLRSRRFTRSGSRSMTLVLGPRTAEAGHRLIVHDTLDSTNNEALRLARAGERGPLWIVAREQTAGRGRRGRAWISPNGNLTTSLLFTDALAP